jgi:hypothetical protein
VTSKAGVIGLTRSLARELGVYNITAVNAIAPGLTISMDEVDAVLDTLNQQRLQARSIKRRDLPQDVVGAAVFLCAAESDFITGQTLAERRCTDQQAPLTNIRKGAQTWQRPGSRFEARYSCTSTGLPRAPSMDPLSVDIGSNDPVAVLRANYSVEIANPLKTESHFATGRCVRREGHGCRSDFAGLGKSGRRHRAQAG